MKIFYAPFSDDTREFLELGGYNALIDLIHLCTVGCWNQGLINKYSYKDRNGNLKINNIMDEIRWVAILNDLL